jgi:hypothetical protein
LFAGFTLSSDIFDNSNGKALKAGNFQGFYKTFYQIALGKCLLRYNPTRITSLLSIILPSQKRKMI